MSDLFEHKLLHDIHDDSWQATVSGFYVQGGERGYRLVPTDQDTHPELGVVVRVLTSAALAEVERAAAEKAWDEGFALATRNSPTRPHPLLAENPYRREEKNE